ncbi:MAG TPA: thiamine phosphate synthase [Paenalcaligenes sp.]|nr:thiamine phosphate synthase [Paenalcaligenes sp.]
MKPNQPTVFPRGLYGITPEWDDTTQLLAAIRAAHRGGMSALQWRRKKAALQQAEKQLQAVIELCQELNLPLIINDQLALALEYPVAGVHLGREDGSLVTAKQSLTKGQWLGASCYNELSRAQEAMQSGADYVAFGALFPSAIKTRAVRAELQLISRARRLCEQTGPHRRVAVVAIGGITPDNARHAFMAGADAVAVISSLFEADDVYAQAQRFVECFQRYAQDSNSSSI